MCVHDEREARERVGVRFERERGAAVGHARKEDGSVRLATAGRLVARVVWIWDGTSRLIVGQANAV